MLKGLAGNQQVQFAAAFSVSTLLGFSLTVYLLSLLIKQPAVVFLLSVIIAIRLGLWAAGYHLAAPGTQPKTGIANSSPSWITNFGGSASFLLIAGETLGLSQALLSSTAVSGGIFCAACLHIMSHRQNHSFGQRKDRP